MWFKGKNPYRAVEVCFEPCLLTPPGILHLLILILRLSDLSACDYGYQLMALPVLCVLYLYAQPTRAEVEETGLQLDIFTFIACLQRTNKDGDTRVSQGQGTPGQELKGEGLLGIA